jgi:hypothetical protein
LYSDGGPGRELGGSIFDGGMSLGERTMLLVVYSKGEVVVFQGSVMLSKVEETQMIGGVNK